jgi:methionyl-tRNA formyltransferase
MKKPSAIFLMSHEKGQRVSSLARQAGVDIDVVIVSDLSALEQAFSKGCDLLMSFGTGVIVPEWILEQNELLAVNVHSATPQYPGRDPHHFAIYDGVTQYGATMHIMTKNVDEGPIIDVEIFDVPADVYPYNLLTLANEAGWELISRFFSSLKSGRPIAPIQGMHWGARKSTRKMFLEMCRIDLAMPRSEIARRYRATAMPGYSNLYLDLHGYRFRIEGQLE